MDFIKNGRPMCNKCPNADRLNQFNFDTKYQGFTKANADELIGKLQILYGHNIIQGDLHLENVMISPNGGIQLIDWGKAKDLSKATSIEQKEAITKEINDFIYILENLLKQIRKFTDGAITVAQSPPIQHLITSLKMVNQGVDARHGGRRTKKRRRKTRRRKTQRRKTRRRKTRRRKTRRRKTRRYRRHN